MTCERINKEAAELMATLFNVAPVADLQRVAEEKQARIGAFMVANGYRLVFDRWFLQAEPKECGKCDACLAS